MKLEHLATMTGFMRKGMTLRDFFTEAVRCNVPGLPFVDDKDRIVGRISIRDVYRRFAVPESVVHIADALGDLSDRLDPPEMKVIEMLAKPVESCVLENMPTVSPKSTIVKALALMEEHNSNYVFLIEDGVYTGVVTRMMIARRMLECVSELERSKGASTNR